MGKVKELPVEKSKVQRVLGGDIETMTLEELSEVFDKLREELDKKTYGISLTQDSIALLLTEILPNVEWVGQQAWDILEAQKVVSELKPDTVYQASKESIRSLFQIVISHKYKGVNNVMQVTSLLTTIAELIQTQIEKDQQVLRDGGFELQAAEMGITPETAMQQAMDAENAAAEK